MLPLSTRWLTHPHRTVTEELGVGGVSKGEGQEMCFNAKAALYLTASFSHGLSTVHTQDSSPDVIQ